MNVFKSFFISLVGLLLLSGCATIELTQSRYGNGIGLSLKSSKKEIDKANYIKLRERQTYLNQKYPSLTRIKRTPIQLDLGLQENNDINLKSINLPSNQRISKEATPVIPTADLEEQEENWRLAEIPEEKNQEPKEQMKSKETQGDMGNLGYLGAVLVIAGLILMLLGIPNGWSVLVLGVILIIIAYFLG
jgi:hypothetical protein